MIFSTAQAYQLALATRRFIKIATNQKCIKIVFVRKVTFFAISFLLGLIAGVYLYSHYRANLPEQAYTEEKVIKVVDMPVIWRGFTSRKLVALTFDDGPDPRFTPKILQILRKQKVKATFFVVGTNAKRYPQLVKQEARDGHLIANHGWDHPEFELLSSKQMQQELDKTAFLIKKLVGYRPKFFQPRMEF